MKETLGNYEVVRLLGKGGMSEVYEAENPRLGSRHALKVYAYPKDDADVRRRFETEGRLLAKLSHPRIVRVTDFGESSDGRPFFAMDLVLDRSGNTRSLADVPAGEADEETIGRWYDDMREGLAYIHGMGVIHRDLKLQNVLIGSDDHVVLTDFGISKIFDPQGGDRTVVDTVQTIVKIRDGRNAVMGSIGYMAPELEMGLPASAQSDWYALGVIVYRLLTGTWCDSRTDVVGTLETYDPVWRRIIPRLLHANPEGRECLSYAEEKSAQRERIEADLEERWLREKSRGHLARHVARYLGVVAVVLALALAFTAREFFAARTLWRLKAQKYAESPKAIVFDDLFKIPAEARSNEMTDSEGNVTMPSRNQFEASRIDALVLTQPILSGLQTGDVTLEKAIREFERYRDSLGQGNADSPLDALEFGDGTYMQMGDDLALKMLLDQAVDWLRARLAEEEELVGQ